MKKIIGLLAALAAIAMLAGPAAAAPDAGIFAGTATVSSAGCHDPSGTGINLTSTGTRTWSIDAPGTVRSVENGVAAAGDLELCGTLNPGLAGLGASCITTSSNDGQGQATFQNGNVVELDNVGWAFTVGGTFLVTGDADGGVGNLRAVVQTFDDQVAVKCALSSANQFLVQAVYSIS